MAAKISVNATDVLGKLNPHIFGTMLENWGERGRHVIYGGVWVGENSPMPNLRGLRKDVLKATKDMGPTIIRWPGGCPADVYHWLDGVGPRKKRPRTVLPAYFSRDVEETNEFGTVEFIDFCREVGAQPYINVNVGTGAPEEAANWVEYCNREGRTKYSAMRVENGHSEPFKVQYWGIGNEIYSDGEVGHMDAESYARAVFEYSKVMRWVDPTVKIVADGYGDEWNYTLLKESGCLIDYISTHKYYIHVEDYYTLMACPLEAEMSFKRITSLINAVSERKEWISMLYQKPEKTKIAVDEWNVWHKDASPPTSPVIAGYQKLSLQDGLFTAGMFHVMAKPCNGVGMANICNLINSGPSGPITSNEETIYVNPQYLAFTLYRHHIGDTVLSSTTDVDAYDANLTELAFSHATMMLAREIFGAGTPKMDRVPYLDCLATLDEEKRKLYLAVINRNKEQDIESAINIKGIRTGRSGKIYELNAEDVTSANDFDFPNNVKIIEKKLSSAGANFGYVFPRHSVTVLEIAAHRT